MMIIVITVVISGMTIGRISSIIIVVILLRTLKKKLHGRQDEKNKRGGSDLGWTGSSIGKGLRRWTTRSFLEMNDNPTRILH